MFGSQKTEDKLDLGYAGCRRRMVEEDIYARGVTDPRVLRALDSVPREEFVPRRHRGVAYCDHALPIGNGQTISQPYTVAYMCEALRLHGHEKVLEIGTGSGYGAAVLAHLVDFVYTIECIPELATTASERLARLGYENVEVICADGSLGLPEHAPFDGIVVTAAAPSVPPSYIEQLKEGSRLVIPLRNRKGEKLYAFTRGADRVEGEDLGGFTFVPLVGKHGARERWS